MQCVGRKRVYIGQRFPTYVQCSKQARPGYHTCWHHRRQEPPRPV